jgi:hypothetical protein
LRQDAEIYGTQFFLQPRDHGLVIMFDRQHPSDRRILVMPAHRVRQPGTFAQGPLPLEHPGRKGQAGLLVALPAIGFFKLCKHSHDIGKFGHGGAPWR